jgi:phenylpropionate dioxygenase-like ring-hydroxylating dioxygenase large terminal subunit
MNADELKVIAARLGANLRERKRDLGDGIATRSAAEFADPLLFAAEIAQIFKGGPLIVGHGAQLPEPGDFITVNFAGPPLLIVRNRHGVLQAFVNACRHRGAALETTNCGQRKALICPYHGWTYDLDGQLTGISDVESFPGVELAKLRLFTVPVQEIGGLIVLCTTPGAALDAQAYLGPLAQHFVGFGIANHRHFRTEVIDTRFNWKIGVEGALETYHFRYIHANTAARLFVGMARIHDLWPPHQRFAIAKRSLANSTADFADPEVLRDQVLLTYLLFPNMLVSFPNDHILLTSFFPNGVAGCQMVYTLLMPAALSGPEHTAHWERTWALTRSVLAEDFAVQESIQRGCDAGREAPLLLGRYETSLAAFRRACDAALHNTV